MKLRWGIMGAGRISNDFIQALRRLPNNEHMIVAIIDRNASLSEEYAYDHDIPRIFKSDEEFMTCKDIDIVYIGLVNFLHKKYVLMALDNGKHVLCEKPLALNYKETAEMVEKAREKKLFLMEALWTRFFPIYHVIRESIDNGEIGQPKVVTSTFGIKFGNYYEKALTKELGAGGLLSIGCYCTFLSQFIFGAQYPKKIVATGFQNQYGTDDTASVTLTYDGEGLSQFTYSASANLENCAVISGTDGQIKIPEPFHCPTEVLINEQVHKIKLPALHPSVNADELHFNFMNSTGLIYEAREVRRCLMAGENESKVMSWEDSIRMAKINDEIRRQLNVTYSQDET